VVFTAVAVAGTEIVICERLSTLATTAPAGIPVPEIGCPTTIPDVDPTGTTVVLPFTVRYSRATPPIVSITESPEAVAAADNTKEFALTVATVAPPGIPVPVTVCPVAMPTVTPVAFNTGLPATVSMRAVPPTRFTVGVPVNPLGSNRKTPVRVLFPKRFNVDAPFNQ
jgi:hypothetical protein